jgi:hypothetical protein
VTAPAGSPFISAVRAYKQEAGTRLDPETLVRVLQGFKELNASVPPGGMLNSTDSELGRALAGLFQRGKPEAELGLLQKELPLFFDAALAAGLIGVHPLRGTARIQSAPEEAAPVLQAAGAQLGAVADYLADILQDGIQQGLLISPLARPMAALQEEGDPLEGVWNLIPRRWFGFATRFPWVLDIFKIGLPVVSLVLALSAWFGPGNPLLSMQSDAMATGNAVKKIQIAANLMMNFGPEETGELTSLAALGQRVGMPLDEEEGVFTLLGINRQLPILYLRHKATGALVFLSPQEVASFRDGAWTRRQ